ncbi:hypothetical protein F4775DRAFT_132556 [Biscogniauxia sp. FL1348]|nr:hypothetical protein F4775DRAFT_132556 [Biscogniauxia sp. FL1348]
MRVGWQITSHLKSALSHSGPIASCTYLLVPPRSLVSRQLFVLTGPPSFCSVPSFQSLASSTCLFSHGRQLIPSHGVHNSPLLLNLAGWGGRRNLTAWEMRQKGFY